MLWCSLISRRFRFIFMLVQQATVRISLQQQWIVVRRIINIVDDARALHWGIKQLLKHHEVISGPRVLFKTKFDDDDDDNDYDYAKWPHTKIVKLILLPREWGIIGHTFLHKQKSFSKSVCARLREKSTLKSPHNTIWQSELHSINSQ